MGTHDLGHIHMMDIGFLGWFSTGKKCSVWFRSIIACSVGFWFVLPIFSVGSMIFIKPSTSHRPRRALPEVYIIVRISAMVKFGYPRIYI